MSRAQLIRMQLSNNLPSISSECFFKVLHNRQSPAQQQKYLSFQNAGKSKHGGLSSISLTNHLKVAFGGGKIYEASGIVRYSPPAQSQACKL